MIDILLARLSRRTCSWCRRDDRVMRAYGVFYNQLPRWVCKIDQSDRWTAFVMRHGGDWHHTHHIGDSV